MTDKQKKDVAKVKALKACSPFGDVERLWFDEFLREPFSLPTPSWWRRLSSSAWKGVVPSVDIFDEGDDVVIKAELPGVRKEDIHTSITNNIITISGEKKYDGEMEKKHYYRVERCYGSFIRSFHLPLEVKADEATAKFENGILEIRIPRTEEAKKKEKKIPIE